MANKNETKKSSRPRNRNDTIENRVYLFESLASSYISASADKLASGSETERARALRALADLAYVSCVVSDTGDEDADTVRELVERGARS